MITTCPKCKADNPDTQKFCGECATPLRPSKDISVSFTKTLETPKKELTRDDTIADKYEIIERLGTGGMGSVYRVEDTKIHEDVAIKIIKPEIAADKNAIEHFKQTIPLLQKNGYYLPFYFETLALAYFKSGDMTKAEDQYQKIISLPTVMIEYGDIYAKSFNMLGKICEQQCDTNKAMKHYEKFLDLWKDADPGIAEVDYAMKRLAELK